MPAGGGANPAGTVDTAIHAVEKGALMLKARVAGTVIAAALVAAGLTACAGGTEPAPTVSAAPGDGVLRIADLTPLTGDMAKYAAAQSAGVELAVREVNEQGGFNGKSITVIHRNAGDAKEDVAAASFKDALTKGSDVIISAASTSATAALVKLQGSNNIAIVAIASKDNVAGGSNASTVKADDAFIKRIKQADPNVTDYTYAVEAYDATIASILAATFAKNDAGLAISQGLVSVSWKNGVKCTSYGACVDALKTQPSIDYVGAAGQITYTAKTGVISFAH